MTLRDDLRGRKSGLFRRYNRLRYLGLIERRRLNRALGMALRQIIRPYTTTLYTCDCPDSQYRGLVCKHRAALMLSGAAEPEEAPRNPFEPRRKT